MGNWFCFKTFRVSFYILLVVFVFTGAGCGETKHEKALEVAKRLTLTGSLSDTEAVESLQQSEKLLNRLVQIKIDAAKWRVRALRRLSEKYIEMGMFEPASKELEKLIDLQPVQPRWYIMKGQLYSRWATVAENKISEAERSFQMALELETNSLPARYGLGVLYAFQADKPQRGRQFLQELSFEQRVTNRTRTYVKKARFALSRLEFQQGNYRKAARILREITDMDTISRDTRFMAYKNLGKVYEQLSSKEMALQAYRQANQVYQHDNEVNKALKRLSSQ
jgi:tetratricopeptide (TPR) repeat protein